LTDYIALEFLTVAQLRALARELDFSTVTKLTKKEHLCQAIRRSRSSAEIRAARAKTGV
jgi:hypothetical protein